MNITILCDQKTCIYNKETGHDHPYEQICEQPDGVLISKTDGCLIKNCFGIKNAPIGTKTKEQICNLLDKITK